MMFENFLSKYSDRDQKVIIGGSVLVIIWALYMFIIDPLMQAKYQQENFLIANQETLAFMKESAATLRANGGSRASQPQVSGSVVILVEGALQRQGLKTPSSIEPKGNDKALVKYDQVNFNKLMLALDQLKDQYGVLVDDAKFSDEKLDTPGMVKASINFVRSN